MTARAVVVRVVSPRDRLGPTPASPSPGVPRPRAAQGACLMSQAWLGRAVERTKEGARGREEGHKRVAPRRTARAALGHSLDRAGGLRGAWPVPQPGVPPQGFQILSVSPGRGARRTEGRQGRGGRPAECDPPHPWQWLSFETLERARPFLFAPRSFLFQPASPARAARRTQKRSCNLQRGPW